MTTKLIGIVFLVVGSAAGCATSPKDWAARGAVLATSPGSRTIVAGPTTVHAYAGFAGGEIYSTRAATGTDADCARGQGRAVVVPVPPDRVVFVTVPAGEVACLHTEDARGYELLWHAVAQHRDPELVGQNDVHRR